MSTSPVNPGAPQPQAGGGAPGGAQGGTNPMQIIAAFTKLAQMLKTAAPPCAPEADEIVNQAQKCAQKLMAGQQQGAQQPSPY